MRQGPSKYEFEGPCCGRGAPKSGCPNPRSYGMTPAPHPRPVARPPTRPKTRRTVPRTPTPSCVSPPVSHWRSAQLICPTALPVPRTTSPAGLPAFAAAQVSLCVAHVFRLRGEISIGRQRVRARVWRKKFSASLVGTSERDDVQTPAVTTAPATRRRWPHRRPRRRPFR